VAAHYSQRLWIPALVILIAPGEMRLADVGMDKGAGSG
jgi:hypothetical protein